MQDSKLTNPDLVEKVYQAILSCNHTITQDEIILRWDGKGKNSLQNLYERIKLALNND